MSSCRREEAGGELGEQGDWGLEVGAAFWGGGGRGVVDFSSSCGRAGCLVGFLFSAEEHLEIVIHTSTPTTYSYRHIVLPSLCFRPITAHRIRQHGSESCAATRGDQSLQRFVDLGLEVGKEGR